MAEVTNDKGQSIGIAVNFAFTLIIGIATPFVLDAIGGYLFVIYGIFMVIVSYH